MMRWAKKPGHYRQVISVTRYKSRLREALGENLFTGDPDSRQVPAGKGAISIDSIEEAGFCYSDRAWQVIQGDWPQGKEQAIAISSGGRYKGKEAGLCSGRYGEEGAGLPEELEEILLADLLSLPLQKEPGKKDGLKLRGLSPSGSIGQLDRKGTILARKHRLSLMSDQGRKGFCGHDLRYRLWEEESGRRGRVVLVAIMDSSASMDLATRQLARTFFYWLVKAFKRKYYRVDTVYIIHDIGAQEVTEERFYRVKGSGGTRFSAAYHLAWEIVTKRHGANACSRFVFHCSDGNNLPTDHQEAVFWLEKLQALCRLITYVEVGEGTDQTSPVFTKAKQAQALSLLRVTIEEREQLYSVLRTILAKLTAV